MTNKRAQTLIDSHPRLIGPLLVRILINLGQYIAPYIVSWHKKGDLAITIIARDGKNTSIPNFRFKYNFRTIVIPAETFDSKAKFLTNTRSAFGGGTFNLSDVNARLLGKYYTYLKWKYDQEQDPKEYYAAEVIGQQTTGYWCLSREVYTASIEHYI